MTQYYTRIHVIRNAPVYKTNINSEDMLYESTSYILNTVIEDIIEDAVMVIRGDEHLYQTIFYEQLKHKKQCNEISQSQSSYVL